MAELEAVIPVLTSNDSWGKGKPGILMKSGTRKAPWTDDRLFQLYDGTVMTAYNAAEFQKHAFGWQQQAGPVSNVILFFEFKKAKEIKKMSFDGIFSYGNFISPEKIWPCYSDDGENFIDIGNVIQIGEAAWKAQTHRETEEFNVGAHRFWGIHGVSDINNVNWFYTGFVELQLYSEPEPEPKSGLYVEGLINRSAENVINKNTDIIKEFVCQIWEPFSILNPTLILKRDDALLACNYVYIPKFGRYYFAKVSVEKGNQMVMECSVDPLESWKDKGLMELSLPIVRQEKEFNMYITDNRVPFLSKGEKQIMKISGGDSPFLTSSQDTGEHFLLNSL